MNQDQFEDFLNNLNELNDLQLNQLENVIAHIQLDRQYANELASEINNNDSF